MELNELIESKEKLKNKIKKLENLISDSKTESDDLELELDILYKKLNELEIEIFWTKEPAISNGVIELREHLKNKYIICLCNKRVKVGEIDYHGYHYSYTFGDVGSHIFEKYRGKGYGYQSLCLLSLLLNENGIDDFWMTTWSDNVASIKTIERYGGKLIDKGKNLLLYECQTLKKEDKFIR